MRFQWLFFAVVLALSVVAIASMTSASVDYGQTLVDGTDDVFHMVTEEAAEFPGIDIVSLTSTRTGNDVNYTMSFVEELNRSATFTVEFDVDVETDPVHFILPWDLGGFSAFSSSESHVPVTGEVAGDNRSLTWSVAVTDIGADRSMDLFKGIARIQLNATINFGDYVIRGETEEPTEVYFFVHYEVVDLNTIVRTRRYRDEGDAAVDLRWSMDTDEDGEVSSAELDVYKQRFDVTGDWHLMPMDRAGEAAASKDLSISLSGAEGPVDDPAPVVRTEVLTATWPGTPDSEVEFHWNSEHTYLDIHVWNATDDSEFSLLISTGKQAENLTLNRSYMSQAQLGFLNQESTRYHMGGADLRDSWNDTMRYAASFGVSRAVGDGNGDQNGGEEGTSWTTCITIAFIIVLVSLFVLILLYGATKGFSKWVDFLRGKI